MYGWVGYDPLEDPLSEEAKMQQYHDTKLNEVHVYVCMYVYVCICMYAMQYNVM